MDKVTKRLKNRRLELGYSYQDLADKTGMSKSTLQRYETGYINNLSTSKLEILAEALDVSPAYLMGWTESTNSEQKLLTLYRKLSEPTRAEVMQYIEYRCFVECGYVDADKLERRTMEIEQGQKKDLRKESHLDKNAL